MARLFVIFALIINLSKLQANETEEGEYKTEVVIGNYSSDITLNVHSKKEYVIHFRKSAVSFFLYTHIESLIH